MTILADRQALNYVLPGGRFSTVNVGALPGTPWIGAGRSLNVLTSTGTGTITGIGAHQPLNDATTHTFTVLDGNNSIALRKITAHTGVSAAEVILEPAMLLSDREALSYILPAGNFEDVALGGSLPWSGEARACNVDADGTVTGIGLFQDLDDATTHTLTVVAGWNSLAFRKITATTTLTTLTVALPPTS